jgi:DNA-directed RNA polymerase specialized sigma24 family protein
MANDKDIEQRMIRWADWLLRSNGAGLGFPRECSYTRMQQSDHSGFTSPEVDLESSQTEKAVQSLIDDHKHAVQVFYLVTGTHEQKAKYLRCHVRTMERRVERAHWLIRMWLDEDRTLRLQKKFNLPLDALP